MNLKRLLWVLLAAAALLLGLWLAGRAPTRYLLMQEVERLQQQRRAQDGRLSLRIGRLEQELAPGERPGPELVALRERRTKLRRTHRELRIRGWDVLLIPATAPRPEPRRFLVVGRCDPSNDSDTPALRGEWEIWIQPSGGLARFVHSLGLSP